MIKTLNSNSYSYKKNLSAKTGNNYAMKANFTGLQQAEKAVEQVMKNHKDVFRKVSKDGIKKLTQIFVGPQERQLVLLGGKSAAGKSTFAELLTKLISPKTKCTRLNMDNFYRDRSKLVTREFKKLASLSENTGRTTEELKQQALTNIKSRANFDLPGAIRHNNAHSELEKLLKGKSAQVPIYDFPTTSITGHNTVEAGQVIIGDSLHALTGHYNDLPGLRVGIISNQKTLLQRWWDRMAFRCPNEPKTVTQGILTNAEKQAKRFIIPSNSKADIIIDNTKPLPELERIFTEILQKATTAMAK